MASQAELKAAVAAARRRFAGIEEDCRDLRPYLVVAGGGCQFDPDAGPLNVLVSCPAAILDDEHKEAVLDVCRQLACLERETAASIRRWLQSEAGSDARRKRQADIDRRAAAAQSRCDTHLPLLRYRDDFRVEIRFERLNYARIRALQTDPRIDRELTPQSGASIRIVIGSVAELASS